jgi:hypothetical protein
MSKIIQRRPQAGGLLLHHALLLDEKQLARIVSYIFIRDIKLPPPESLGGFYQTHRAHLAPLWGAFQALDKAG